jgi:hypothetical protein
VRPTARVPSATHQLRPRPLRYSLRGEPKAEAIMRECALHDWTTFVRIGKTRYRCGRCNSDSVAARRRRIKHILVSDAGGRCLVCGFSRYTGLHFHHVDPARKAFSVSRDGVTRSLARAREEANKCVLLCANCHAMVEAGVLDLAAATDHAE